MPSFRASRCTRFRYRYSECRRCADACPHAAITLTDEGTTLDGEKCKHCALCVSACHTGAWSSDLFQPIDLLRQAIQKPTWSLACEPSGYSADAVVPCLGAIDAVWLAYMARRGIPVSLHGSSHCQQCTHGRTGEAQLKLNLEGAQHLRDAALAAQATQPTEPQWPLPTLAEDAQTEPRRQRLVQRGATTLARRSLFQRIFRRTAEKIQTADAGTTKAPTVPAQAIRAGAYASSDRRELLQILTKQKDGSAFLVAWHETLPLMKLSLHSGCTLCEACFRVCPTGAIQIVENPGDWALTFQADRCVGCEVCLEVCQPRVLDAEASFDARPEQPPTVLISRVKQRCARCDRHFVSVSPQPTCSVCGDDEEAFAAIFG